MSFEEIVLRLLEQDYCRTAAKLIVWGMIAIVLLAVVSLLVPVRYTRRKLAWTGTCLWIGVFALAYLDQVLSESLSSYRVGYERQIYCILPLWFFIGLGVLWGAYWLRLLIEKRKKVLLTRRRGFPVVMPDERDK